MIQKINKNKIKYYQNAQNLKMKIAINCKKILLEVVYYFFHFESFYFLAILNKIL